MSEARRLVVRRALQPLVDQRRKIPERQQRLAHLLDKGLGGGVPQLHFLAGRKDQDRVGKGAQRAFRRLLRLQDLLARALAIGAQLGRHLVEGRRQLAQLVVRLYRHVLVEIPLPELLGRFGQAVHRPQNGTRQRIRRRGRDHEAHQQRHDHVARRVLALLPRRVVGLDHVLLVQVENVRRRLVRLGKGGLQLAEIKSAPRRVRWRQRHEFRRRRHVRRVLRRELLLELAFADERDVVRLDREIVVEDRLVLREQRAAPLLLAVEHEEQARIHPLRRLIIFWHATTLR